MQLANSFCFLFTHFRFIAWGRIGGVQLLINYHTGFRY